MDKEYGRKHHALLNSEIRKSITRLFKQYLNSLEDIQYAHGIAVEKLRNHVSPENLEMLSYLDNDHYSLVRKRILDNGNEAMRDLENLLDNFDVSLKDNNKLDFGNQDNKQIIEKRTQGLIYEEETQ